MVLAFDIGNSFAKWGFVQDGAVVGGGRVAHRAQGLAAALDALRLERTPTAIVAVNVAGDEAAAALDAWAVRRCGARARFVTARDPARRVRSLYREPAQLGADRWAAVVGGFHAHGACLVADLGTACTLDVVDGDGVHAGGYILPGIELMRGALAGGTAAVRVEEVEVAPGAWGRDTAEGVAAGSRRALASLIAAAARERAPSGAELLLTGGDAERIAPWLAVPHRIDHALVLRGAVLLAEGKA